MVYSGWVKLYRKIMECLIWNDDKEPFDKRSAWIDLILLANHSDTKMIFDGKPITVKAGQRITSIRILSERWHWSKDRVKRFLDLLESEGMIIRDSDNRRTLLTIVNYGTYQGERDTDKDSDKDTHKDTHKDSNKDTDKSQTRMNKNEKNEKNDKNEKKIYGEYRHVRLTESEREKLDIDFGVEKALDLITYLDEYIEMKGYKAKNHNLAIRKWVVDAVEKQKKKQPSGDAFHEDLQRMADWSKDEWAEVDRDDKARIF